MDELEAIKKEILIANLPLSENNLVFGKGNPKAKILFIGEAPGAKEDELGVPFVGQAGKELDKLLNGIGLGIEDVYIANILKYRPPNNRNPTMEEIKSHTPFLIKQIEVINPKIISTLGNYATKFVLAGFNTKEMNKIEGIGKIHGKPKNIFLDGTQRIVIPLYHPASMLYNPNLRQVLQQDFSIISSFL